VGLMDADVYGPSILRMMGGSPSEVSQEGNRLIPVEKHGVIWMSMALLTDEDTPVIWRGPMATRLVQQFLGQVNWGSLDYLFIDLPPGTGDVQLTLTQAIELTGAVVVSTPQAVAIDVATRGLKMFEEVRVPILGLLENMSGFLCGHCDQETPVLGQGAVQAKCKDLGLPFLGSIPMDPSIAMAGDRGKPIASEDHPIADRFATLAKELDVVVSDTQSKNSDNIESPQQISSDENHVLLMWRDGSISELAFKDLRFHCPCATCVNEVTGARMITQESIKDNIEPVGFRPVGKYGLQISWNDGHNTGIYTFSFLKNIQV